MTDACLRGRMRCPSCNVQLVPVPHHDCVAERREWAEAVEAYLKIDQIWCEADGCTSLATCEDRSPYHTRYLACDEHRTPKYTDMELAPALRRLLALLGRPR